MMNFKVNKRRWGRMNAESTYQKNFSLAVLNYETNRQEDRFGLRGFDLSGARKLAKS